MNTTQEFSTFDANMIAFFAAILIGIGLYAAFSRTPGHSRRSQPSSGVDTKTIRNLAQRAERADLDWLTRRLTRKGVSARSAAVLVQEFRRLIALMAAGVPVTLEHGQLDDVWHEALLDTRRYLDFCQEVCGRMIHHSPGDAPQGDSAALTAYAYTQAFGHAPPSIWPKALPEAKERVRKRHQGTSTASTDTSSTDSS